MKKNLFITGLPGVGKTSLVMKVVNKYPEKFGGFYTKEIREDAVRKGFMICTTDGKQDIFALKGLKSKYVVGSYGVNIDVLENVGISALMSAVETKEIILIDEIGKMELFSEKFRTTVLKCLNLSKKVLATIKFTKDKFTDELKLRKDIEILELKKENYNLLLDYIERWVLY
ncbi:MAG: NTPase [Elusimicrobiota bacterium]|nr:NTPase [Elusimicrobiota bacterium]